MQVPGFSNIILHSPWYLLLLLLLPLMHLLLLPRRKERKEVLDISTLKGLERVPQGWKVRYRPVLKVLRYAAFLGFILALARPQQTNVTEDVNSEGIDIVLSIDISGSMLAEDFKPNRIEASKEVATRFVRDRPSDRIGLVIFSGESFTQCPITIDHNVLVEQLEHIKSGMLADGTAIGMGLATAVDRLRHAKSKSRVVILLTDGVNNTGLVDPETALQIAKTYGVRVYTVGVGSKGNAMYPVPDQDGNVTMQMMPVQIDEALLTKISKETGGKYFRATNNTSLQKIYKEIDQLEKTKVEVNAYKHYKEWFWPFALLGVLCLALEMLLRYTLFKSIP